MMGMCCCKDGTKKDQHDNTTESNTRERQMEANDEPADEKVIYKRFIRAFEDRSFRVKKGEVVAVKKETPTTFNVQKKNGHRADVPKDALEDVQINDDDEEENREADSDGNSSLGKDLPSDNSKRKQKEDRNSDEAREHPPKSKCAVGEVKRKTFSRDWQHASFHAKKGQVVEVMNETTTQSYVKMSDGRKAYVPNDNLEDIDWDDDEKEETTELDPDTPRSSKNVVSERSKNVEDAYRKSRDAPELLPVSKFDPRTFIAKRSYDSIRDDEKGVKEGECLIRLKEGELSWKMKRQKDPSKVGLVPASMLRPIKFQDEQWYFGEMDNVRSCKLLLQKNLPEGTFLVRDSATQKENLTLSVRVNTKEGKPDVVHFRISVSKPEVGDTIHYKFNSQKTITECCSSQELIMQYKNNHLRTTNGLIVPLNFGLVNPVKEDIDFPSLADIKIDPSHIRKHRQLGEGNYGTVFKATWTRNEGKITVAVKESKTQDRKDGVEDMKREAEAMCKLRHTNIVSLFGYCYNRSEDSVLLVFEFVSKGDLAKYLQKCGDEDVKELDILYYALQVADGMRYLAGENIVHRDLAARNVLLGENQVVKIADFGLARFLSDERIYAVQNAQRKIPIRWTAPEALKERAFTEKSDVWSYGIFLTELVTGGKTPYPDITDIHLLPTVLERGRRMQQNELSCSDDIYKIMTSCWRKDPEDRPNFENLFETVQELYVVIMEADYPNYNLTQ